MLNDHGDVSRFEKQHLNQDIRNESANNSQARWMMFRLFIYCLLKSRFVLNTESTENNKPVRRDRKSTFCLYSKFLLRLVQLFELLFLFSEWDEDIKNSKLANAKRSFRRWIRFLLSFELMIDAIVWINALKLVMKLTSGQTPASFAATRFYYLPNHCWIQMMFLWGFGGKYQIFNNKLIFDGP